MARVGEDLAKVVRRELKASPHAAIALFVPTNNALAPARAHAKVVEAMTALSAARVAMVDAHNEMNEIKLRLGVRTKMNGVEKAVVRGEESAPLRIVNSN